MNETSWPIFTLGGTENSSSMVYDCVEERVHVSPRDWDRVALWPMASDCDWLVENSCPT